MAQRSLNSQKLWKNDKNRPKKLWKNDKNHQEKVWKNDKCFCNSIIISTFARFFNRTMLERKFSIYLRDFLEQKSDKIMLLNGARQIGKSYIIRYVGQQLFEHYVEIDLRADKDSAQIFANVRSKDDFYFQLGVIAGDNLGNKHDTLIFLDEIQVYPHLLTLLKFLNQDHRYRYIASGSQLGVALAQTTSVPLGSVEIQQMYPLDFEEFMWAMNVGKEAIYTMRQAFIKRQSLPISTHDYIMKLFRYYLLVGGLPEAVNNFVKDKNMFNVRTVQSNIHTLYGIDASQYDKENSLKIRKIYDLIPSNLENKKKRVVYKNIENKKGKQYSDYENEFEYLTQSGIALDVSAIRNPKFPLMESTTKDLLKLYLNDVGILTFLLYRYSVDAIMNEQKSINLGTVYESVVAQELKAHGFDRLYYYDNKQRGEVDFLIDDFNNLSVLPIEVKSGRDYTIHSALTHFTTNNEYHINEGIVLSNAREIKTKGKITYLPIYYVMFLNNQPINNQYVLQ